MQVTQVEQQEWATSPVAEKFLSELRESRQETMEHWASEQYTGDSAEKTLQVNAKALGGISVLNQVIEKIEGMREEL